MNLYGCKLFTLWNEVLLHFTLFHENVFKLEEFLHEWQVLLGLRLLLIFSGAQRYLFLLYGVNGCALFEG
jgi:hypothetical protein